ncbi:MAG: transglutaminase-like domain-containing protein [Spirochaetes bacterium]|nr:transglutaminase-like domain-containing protein [Spirochaetota bacterium]
MARALRNLLWLYLFYHWYLHFQEYLSLIPVLILWAGAIGLGYLAHRMHKRFLATKPFTLVLTLLLTGLSPIFFYYLAKGIVLLGGIGFEDTTWDLLLLTLDRYVFFMILPVELLSLSTLLVYGTFTAFSLEPAFLGILLAFLFFPEGGFRAHLYAHPLSLGISVSLYLLGECILLVLTSGEVRENERAKAQQRSSSYWGIIQKSLPYLALLLLALYIAYDRYTAQSLEARGGLLKAELFRFDFTHYLSLETEIRQTKDLVLLYRRSEPIDRYLLKRFLLEGYEPGKGFFRDPSSPDPLPTEMVPPYPRSFPLRETKGRKSIHQELYIINLDPQALVALDYPLRIVPFRTWSNSTFSRVYQVESMALTILPLELSEVKGPRMDPKTLEYYTEYGKDLRIKALAEEITRGIDTYYDKVQAITDYLRYDYFYSLKPGKAPDGDQLGHFLFSSKKGYCSYFAFSMALLCRSLGIPSRVVIGFYIDPDTELLGYYPIRSDMAHAWVEVYFDGFGWVDFDPTSRTPAPGETPFPGVQFKREDIASLLKEILSHSLEAEPLPADKGDASKDFTPPLGKVVLRTFAQISVIALLASGIGSVLLVRFRYRLKAFFCKSPRERIQWAFWDLLQDLAPLGFVMNPSQTLKEALEYFLNQFAFEEAKKLWELFHHYQFARFGKSFGPHEADRFFTIHYQIRKKLYLRNNFVLRILLRFHPKTFRRPIR